MNVEAYLNRMLIEEPSKPTLDFLTILQNNHMESIPFENLDVTRKVEILLDTNRFHEKIIDYHRGGFCYELNGLFQQLLTALGYHSYFISCTVKRPNGWAKENTHAAIIVQLEEPYLVDVGFGDSVRQPLPLTGEERTDVSGTYRVMKTEENKFILQRLENNEWKILYRFSNTKRQLIDFTEGCLYNQTSPDSTFTHGDIVTIATKTGRISLSGLIVTETKNGKKVKFELTNEEKEKFLQDTFQITL